jgi:hypothetical protein
MTEENMNRKPDEPIWNPEDEHRIKPLEDLPTPAFQCDQPLAEVFYDFVKYHMQRQREAVMYGRRDPADIDRKDVASDFFDEHMREASAAIEDHNGLGAIGTAQDAASSWARMVGLLEFAFQEGIQYSPYNGSYSVPRRKDGLPDFKFMEKMPRYRDHFR